MKKSIKAILGLAVLFAVAVTAYALTTFNPATGTGFVGKGDLQTPWGWNDATLQSNADGVSFAFTSSADYAVTCEWDTGTVHIVHHVQTHSVDSAVAYDVKKANRLNPLGKVTGFNLEGFGALLSEGGDPIPAVGDGCPGNSGLGAVTAVVPLGSGSGDTLTASSLAPTGPTVIWANGVSVHP